MKLKWNGFDLELTVEELKQMAEKGLIDPEDEKVPYPDTWEELLKRIADRPTQPLQPNDQLKPYVNPQPSPFPFPFPTVTAYGCQSIQTPLGGVAQWDGTTALNGKLNINDGDDDTNGKPACLRP